MRKFLLRVLIFAVYALFLQVILPLAVDPFNVFHADNIRSNGVEPNKNYIKMKYILNNPDKFDGFIFGSSRVSSLHPEKINKGKIYNMTYSVGIPEEHLKNIKTFISNGILPKRIYIGLDAISYTVNIEQHIQDPMRCPYEYLRDNPEYFYSLYLNIIDTISSLGTILIRPHNRNIHNVFYNYGWDIDYNMPTRINPDSLNEASASNREEYYINETINCIKNIIHICRQNNIELKLFTNPMRPITFMTIVENLEYLKFLEELAKISEFYNFSGINNISVNDNNFCDISHSKAEVGDMIINVICNGEIYPELYKQGFGVKVTRENVRELINMLRKQAEDYRQNKSPAE